MLCQGTCTTATIYFQRCIVDRYSENGTVVEEFRQCLGRQLGKTSSGRCFGSKFIVNEQVTQFTEIIGILPFPLFSKVLPFVVEQRDKEKRSTSK